MPRKLFKSLRIGEYFTLNHQDIGVELVRIKNISAKGTVPFFNARDTETGQLVYVPIRRYVYGRRRKGKRK